MVTISDARITFVYGECFTGHLEIEPEEHPVLWEEWVYHWAYNQIRGDSLTGYAFPWRDSQKSAFWRHYLGDTPGSVPAERAWEKFVPLRLLLDVDAIGTDSGERVLVDVFGFPHGIVVALTVHVAKSAAMPMSDWVNRLRAVRFGAVFLEGTTPRTLEELCGSLLDTS